MNVVMTRTQQRIQSEERPDRWLTVPNALCMIRLVGAFVLIPLAIGNRPIAFVVTFFVLSSTDWIDGKLARWLNQTSKIGPKLDTAADMTMYAALIFGMTWLFGRTLLSELGFIGVAVATYLGSCLASLIKFRRLPSYHTRGAKISWFLVMVAVLTLFLELSIWPLRIAALAVALTNLEAILITIALAKKQDDVPSIFHAIWWPKKQRPE